MRNLKFLLLLTFFSTTLNFYAQKDVTTFMGIPIDGPKEEMIKKLRLKGFKNIPNYSDVLTGTFNGTDVNVFIVTNNDKVYRIMVSDYHTRKEGDIRIRYNNLCQQFSNNKKYIPADAGCMISDDEDISYKMLVETKRYEAIFYQQSEFTEEDLQSFISSAYTPEQLVNTTKEFRDKIREDYTAYVAQKQTKKPVWYMITEDAGRYKITMYYDNEYNSANGEDL